MFENIFYNTKVFAGNLRFSKLGILIQNFLVRIFFIDIIISYRYKRKVEQIRTKDNVNVLFLVRETSKWNADTLYKSLEKNSRFNPFIVISLFPTHFPSEEKQTKQLQSMKFFFEQKGFVVKIGYNVKLQSNLNLKLFQPDIIFYDQPWGLSWKQFPLFTSKYALNCYLPYGFMLVDNKNLQCRSLFHLLLWKYFCPDSAFKEIYIEANGNQYYNQIIVSGYPKLDTYNQPLDPRQANKLWPSENKSRKRVIYAPHHSLGEDKLCIKFATFRWNGLELLEFAEQHKDVEWVFKPHPMLTHSLVANNVMTHDKADEYYKKWETLPNTAICDQGDYFDLFKSSDALITDCISFLAEYLPTEKPILQLINPNSKQLNKVGKALVKHYYKVYSLQELLTTFERVVLREEDNLKQLRAKTMKELQLSKNNSGKFIKDYLLSKLS